MGLVENITYVSVWKELERLSNLVSTGLEKYVDLCWRKIVSRAPRVNQWISSLRSIILWAKYSQCKKLTIAVINTVSKSWSYMIIISDQVCERDDPEYGHIFYHNMKTPKQSPYLVILDSQNAHWSWVSEVWEILKPNQLCSFNRWVFVIHMLWLNQF